MEILFSSFIKSVKFLRGLIGVEMGFIFAGRGGIGRKQLSKIVLPRLTAKLFDAVKLYASELLSFSKKINEVIRSCDVLSSRLAEIATFCDAAENELTEALNGKKNLRNTKILLEAAFELNSEMSRVFGYFFTAHFSKSTAVSLKMMQLLGLWSLSIFRAKRNMASVEMIQTNLLKGQISSDESSRVISESSASWTETSDVTKMLSALTNLHFNVLAWSIRIHNLREKVAAQSMSASLPDLVAGDLESMSLLLNSCQLCLNEASAVLRRESGSGEGSVKLIPLDSEIAVEYECLEAFVGEDDNQSNGMVDEFYDEFDNLGRPLTKSEMKKRTAERAILLTELNSVIAHRAVETREREEKALNRARVDPGRQPPTQPNPVSQQSVLFEKDGDINGTTNRQSSNNRLDLKRRTILRSQNFNLLSRPLEPIQSKSEECSIPYGNGDGGASSLSRPILGPSIMPEDLRAMIQQRLQGVQPSQLENESVFDDIGTGEDVEELAESE
nr:hypothetical transcript [Hymenolepis microstoma]